MTIISDRQLHAASPQGPIRSRAGGQSFASRIEAGDRAKDIMKDKALGFSEAGLLGLHYGHDLSNNVADQSGPISGADFTPEAMVPTGAKLVDSAVIISDNETVLINVPRNRGETSGSVNALGPNLSLQNLAPSLPSLEIKVVGPDESANELPSPVSKISQKAISQSRPGIKFGLTVIETPQGISVICKELAVSENEIQELTELAEQIAKDFGVTLRRLVVNGKNSA